MAGGQPALASLDCGHVCGLNAAAPVGTQLAGTVIGVRGDTATRIGALFYALSAGMPMQASESSDRALPLASS
jgi:hemolysin activation/secretion protein